MRCFNGSFILFRDLAEPAGERVDESLQFTQVLAHLCNQFLGKLQPLSQGEVFVVLSLAECRMLRSLWCHQRLFPGCPVCPSGIVGRDLVVVGNRLRAVAGGHGVETPPANIEFLDQRGQ